jgi:hypothetical protein
MPGVPEPFHVVPGYPGPQQAAAPEAVAELGSGASVCCTAPLHIAGSWPCRAVATADCIHRYRCPYALLVRGAGDSYTRADGSELPPEHQKAARRLRK